MNLKTLSDSQLLEKTEALAQRERVLLTEILHHLREIETRRLFSSLGFKSLFDYAVKKLGYSADQAARRIAAMRLLKELPEIEEKIEQGSLNLTNLGMAQRLFKSEPVAKDEKLELLQRLENKSTREAEKIVLARSSDPIQLRPDRTRAVAPEKVEISFVADEALAKKLEKLKGLLAHTDAASSTASLINRIADIAIEQLSPAESPARQRCPQGKTKKSPAAPLGHRGKGQSQDLRARRPYISVKLKREVWRKAESKCQNCGSNHALQIDHIQPKAMGGADDMNNLRLLCRSCNQRAAIITLGIKRMRPHLEK